MKLLDSLLDAIVRLEGDALVMHVGEKPYVVTTSSAMNAYRGPLAWGQVELSSRVLTTDAVQSMLTQILPADQCRALDEFGAIEHEIAAPHGITDRFTVVAARGGDDIWLELRRQPVEVAQPEPVVHEQPAMVAEAAGTDGAVAAAGPAVHEPPPTAPGHEAALAQPEHMPLGGPAPHPEALATGSEIEERVPVLDEVSQHEPEHIEHVVISVGGRDGHEEVPLDTVPSDAFEVIDDEPQEAPSDSEVDAMLAATAAALLTSGLGADVETVGDDADLLPLESTALDEELSAALADAEHGEGDWSETVIEEVELTALVPDQMYREPELQAEAATPIPETGEVGSVQEFAAEESARDEVAGEATPTGIARDHVAGVPPPITMPPEPQAVALAPDSAADAHPPDVTIQPARDAASGAPEPYLVQPSAEPESLPTAASAETGPAMPPSASERVMVMPGAVAEPSSGEPATPELQAAHEIPTTEAEASTKTPIAEELPAAAETEQEAALAGSTTSDSVPGEHERVEVEQEEPGVIGPVAPVVPPVDERMVAAGVASAHLPDTVIPETAAAASVLPPAPIAEPRIPVSETLPELHGHGAHAPGSYQDSQSGPADTRHGVVVPLGRSAARADAGGVTATLHSALRTAGARGASTVYLVAQSKPVIRVNGEIVVLENEPVLTAADVQGLVTELAPPQRQPDQGEAVEWMSDVPDVGRVRCLTFRDHRGPGVIFRMDHVGLPAEVRALCSQPDGLVVIAGPHASGKSTLLNSFVDQINVTRGDHVIALESHIGFVHESRRSFISQRELSDDAAQAAATARAALREDPDVMVIEDLRSADLTAVALEAAESGRLVFVSVSAPSAVMAIQQLLESFPADRRARAARSLSNALRGVVTQVLVRRARGGRAPAREVLLNTPTVASMIRDGRTGDLPSAFESGRGQGMVSMTDALMGLVREGAVQPAEAYRKASDRSTLLGRLKQEGVDTAFADRLV